MSILHFSFFFLGGLISNIFVLSQIWGTNIHFTTPQTGELEQLVNGFKIARNGISWANTEKTLGVYDFSAYDSLLQKQENLKIKTLWILCCGNNLYDNGLSPATQNSINGFTNWAVAAIKHFQGHSIIWEIWNEPDNNNFWKPQANSTAYSNLVVAVGKALIQANLSNEIIVGPATSYMNWDYIEDTFKLGVLTYFNYVSVHPYRNDNPETVLLDYSKLNSLIKQYNALKPQGIYATEWGYTDCGPCTGPYYQVSSVTQGKYLARQWLTNTFAGISVSIYYDWKNDGNDTTNNEDNFGSVNYNYQNSSQAYIPKDPFLSAVTLQTYLSPNQVRYNKPVNPLVNGVVDSNAYVLGFTAGAGTDVSYAIWKTSISQTCENIPLSNRHNCGYTGITSDECINQRKCCYDNTNTNTSIPSCYLQETTSLLSFNATLSGSLCFRIINYLGQTITSEICPMNGMLTVTASDGPIYLISY